MTKRALIVGVSGQDGAYLSSLLLGKGYEVIGASRDAQVDRLGRLAKLGILPRITMESMNPVDFQSTIKVVSKWRPDEVYNLSGQSSVALSFAQPSDALNSILNSTATLLEVIRFLDRPVRFYNAGSSECFGEVSAAMADESTPFRPRSPYATAKAAAHWMVANYREGYGMFACTGILFNHESPLRPERFVTKKIVSAAARIAGGSSEKLTLGNMQVRRDWGWAPEYVDAMWRMLQQEKANDYVVATGVITSLEAFVESAFRAAGLEWRDHVVTDRALLRPTDLEGFAGDSSLAQRTLGWRATTRMPDVAVEMVREEMRERNGSK